MSKIVAIIQARLSSTRLPRKVLADICGKPMVQHVVERAQPILGVTQVVLAVPNEDVAEFVAALPKGLCAIRGGPRDDVLRRFVEVADGIGADLILRVTGDCPLLDPFCCYEVLCHIGKDASFSTNDTRVSGWPDGLDAEAFKRVLLDEAHSHAVLPYDREHVTPWMRRSQFSYPVVCREPDEFSKVKLSVDTQEDLDRVRRLMARIPAGDYSWKATQEAIGAEALL